jgi:hypothetical protein
VNNRRFGEPAPMFASLFVVALFTSALRAADGDAAGEP